MDQGKVPNSDLCHIDNILRNAGLLSGTEALH
jgi:hypothetical protein